jgi:hypothetical protein
MTAPRLRRPTSASKHVGALEQASPRAAATTPVAATGPPVAAATPADAGGWRRAGRRRGRRSARRSPDRTSAHSWTAPAVLRCAGPGHAEPGLWPELRSPGPARRTRLPFAGSPVPQRPARNALGAGSNEGMPSDHDAGNAVLLEPTPGPQPRLQPTVIALDPVVGVLMLSCSSSCRCGFWWWGLAGVEEVVDLGRGSVSGAVASAARGLARQTVAMSPRRPRPPATARSAFAGFCFPPDVIVLAVRWYLRFGLMPRRRGTARRTRHPRSTTSPATGGCSGSPAPGRGCTALPTRCWRPLAS